VTSRPDYRFGYDSTKARQGRPDYRFSYDRNRRIDRSERTKRDFDRDRRHGRHGADYDKRRPGRHGWHDKDNGKDYGKSHHDHKGHYNHKGHHDHKGYHGGKTHHKKVVKNYYYGGYGYGGYGYWWRPYRSYCPTFSLGYSGHHDGLSFSIGLGASYWDDWCSFTYGPSYGYSNSRPYYASSANTVVVIDDREPDVVYTPGSTAEYGPDLTVGWEHLATGRDEQALQYFSNRVQRWGDSADAKVGYALAAAQQNDPTRAVWSMRRAFRIDDGSLGYLPLDSRLYSLVELHESRFVFEAERSTGREQRDALFMVAALRFILHDMPGALDAATEAQRLGDHDTSVRTLIANAELELGS